MTTEPWWQDIFNELFDPMHGHQPKETLNLSELMFMFKLEDYWYPSKENNNER